MCQIRRDGGCSILNEEHLVGMCQPHEAQDVGKSEQGRHSAAEARQSDVRPRSNGATLAFGAVAARNTIMAPKFWYNN